jgi:hypothetical protein
MSRHAKYERTSVRLPLASSYEPEPGKVLRLALVGCCKEKKANEQGFALARDLYQSDLFRKSLAYAEANFEHVAILSAMRGVVDLTDPLRIYDFTMSDMGAEGRAFWAHDVLVCQVGNRARRESAERVELVVFAGRDYVEPLRAQLPEFPGWSIEEPLAGLQVGERLHWLKERSAA